MALPVIIAKTTPKATPKTPLKACLTVSRRIRRTAASTSETASAAIAEMCRSLLTVKIVTNSRPGTTVSTMPRTPPNASNSAASVTFLPSAAPWAPWSAGPGVGSAEASGAASASVVGRS